MQNYRRIEPWDVGLILVGLFILKYLIMAPFMAVFMVLVIPFTLLSFAFGWKPPEFPWGTAVASRIIAGAYVWAWYWRGVPPRFKPPWLMELVARIIHPLEESYMAMNQGRKDRRIVGPTPGNMGPGTGGQIARWEPSGIQNEALERLMGDLLSNQPENQGWLGGLAASLREQAQAGRLQGNMERIVAILEEEKKRMQALVEINKLSGHLQQAGLEKNIEEKRIALERLKVEHEAEQAALEMREMLDLKPKEQALKLKQVELEMARVERELTELRRKPEPPPAPREQEAPEVYATRLADQLIKYAGEIRRIRASYPDDPDVADDLVDRFLTDMKKREG